MSKKKKQQARNKKYLFETSAQITRLTPNPKGVQINKLTTSHKVYSSFFVLYEFKSGFIRNLIDYYFLAKACNTPPEASVAWTQRWGIREQKNKGLLDAKMGQIFGSIEMKDKAIAYGKQLRRY